MRPQLDQPLNRADELSRLARKRNFLGAVSCSLNSLRRRARLFADERFPRT